MKDFRAGASSEPLHGKSHGSPAADRLTGPDATANGVCEVKPSATAEARFEISEPTLQSIDRPASEDASHAKIAAGPALASEKVLVFDAMRALRREGRPEQAAKLAAEYLHRNPQGKLAEEALAIAMEASTALGDPRGKNFADQYLASYPTGRFRVFAERVRMRFSP